MEPARRHKYTYKTFAPIRLLSIRRNEHGRICGHLENFYLDDARCPQFLTFSYVWGDERSTRDIQIDGTPFPVLKTLYPLLEAICDYDCFKDDRWVWIDSICINQEDEHERAQQVQLMGRIYQQSTRTAIWLGTQDNKSKRAMDFLHQLADFMVHKPRTTVPASAYQPETWDSVRSFFQRPWWTRVWTLQEIVLPSTFDIHCGRMKIGESNFREAMHGLYWCSEQKGISGGDIWGVGWGRRRVRQVFDKPELRGKISLAALLAFTGNYKCHDPKDRIYSLLGVAREEDRAMVGPPDYSKKNTVEAVYTNLVMRFIEAKGSLDIICFASLFRSPGVSSNTSWPSWLPDWRVDVRPRTVPLMVSQPGRDHIGCFRPLPWKEASEDFPVFCASGSLLPRVIFNATSLTLSCKGVCLSTVDGMTTSLIDNDDGGYSGIVYTQSTSPNNTADMEETALSGTDLPMELIRTLAMDRYSRYFKGFTPRRWQAELSQVMRDDTTGFDQQATQAARFLKRWIVHNRDFLIRGQTLLEICESAKHGNGRHSPPPRGGMHLPERLVETIGLNAESGVKVLATLKSGSLALVPADSAKGDSVWVLQGCSVPLVLRKQHRMDEYTHVGEAYVHRFMGGEAFDGGFEIEDVVIG
ncbi:heterokaryon incompatibility protein-domain-containing protein [Podospora aff. communis PSN243]|uniref:Heterokaryon incompatibility protein-domain-containing protein n=1 Tax=Podospora aff. communis PSN243 TaxID=3040156 RepID=A0AAV9GEH2_9PEZI|nr:heterokaryon incompatibility protein-domain-containing protein [Podospora aff. communis PSN243]